jgi:sugar/nucleoside kinase (ribokinase family)
VNRIPPVGICADRRSRRLRSAVLVVGDLITDVVAVYSGALHPGADTPAGITVRGGGSGANTAAWLAALRVPTGFVGVVGADEAGVARVRELSAAGVRTLVRHTAGAPTGTVVVLSGGDERTMLSDRGANRALTAADIDAGLATGARHVHLSGYVLLDPGARAAGRHALAAAAGGGATTSVDTAAAAGLRAVGAAAFRSWVRGTDLLLANLAEADVLVGPGSPAELAGRLADVAAHAVVKCGAAGAVWASAGTAPVTVPAEQVPVVDATGAGDAFTAGLLARWLAGGSPVQALLAGVAAGARAVRLVGGRPPPG